MKQTIKLGKLTQMIEESVKKALNEGTALSDDIMGDESFKRSYFFREIKILNNLIYQMSSDKELNWSPKLREYIGKLDEISSDLTAIVNGHRSGSDFYSYDNKGNFKTHMSPENYRKEYDSFK